MAGGCRGKRKGGLRKQVRSGRELDGKGNLRFETGTPSGDQLGVMVLVEKKEGK